MKTQNMKQIASKATKYLQQQICFIILMLTNNCCNYCGPSRLQKSLKIKSHRKGVCYCDCLEILPATWLIFSSTSTACCLTCKCINSFWRVWSDKVLSVKQCYKLFIFDLDIKQGFECPQLVT